MAKAGNVVLVVGSSGVGKSTACKGLPNRVPSVTVRYLDLLAPEFAIKSGLMSEGNVHALRDFLDIDRFLEVGLQAVVAAASETTAGTLVVDVGSGFQHSPAAVDLPNSYHVVALVAEPSVAYARWITRKGNERFSFDHYHRTEFEEIDNLIRRCKRIDTTRLDPDSAADALAAEVRRIAE